MDSDLLQKSFLSHLRNERGLAETTIATYSHHIDGYLGFLKERGLSPTTASSADVTVYQAGLRQRALRPPSIFCSTIAIRTLYRFLVAKGHITNDLTTELRIPKLTTTAVEALSTEDVEKLLATPSKGSFTGIRDRAILELLYCGGRIGEVLSLETFHIHMHEGYVKVVGKGSKERLVPIGKKAIESLSRYIKARDARFASAPTALFLSLSGNQLGKNGFWRQFKRYAVRAGIIRPVHPHLLRHSYAVHMLAGRADLRSLQLLLGHSSLNTTQKYLNLDFNSLRETCRKAHPRF